MLIIKGNLVFTPTKDMIETIENAYIGVLDGVIAFVSKQLPNEYKDTSIIDYGDKLIIPGFCDLHTHAPQFENIGLCMDEKLLTWLEKLTFPTEAKYKDAKYAKKMYTNVVSKMITQGTTRAVFFATVHADACQALVDVMREYGMRGYVGKVNMDANCPDYLIEDADDSISETVRFYESNMKNTDIKPIITPRFVPSCTQKTLERLGELAKKYDAPVQSHINETINEIKWVGELYPNYQSYSDIYDKNNLLNAKTVMAHCIHMKEKEVSLFANKGVVACHCPQSNANLASGIMPIKKWMDKGMKVAFGTDVSGGNDISILKTMVLAIQLSRIRFYQDASEGYLSLSEALYIATKGGGSYFGKVGSFEKGYEFDALIVDDSDISIKDNLSLEQRTARFIYGGDDRNIVKRYIFGKEV
jgi:guanine deaminase